MMVKSLSDQIFNKCVHFNGIRNDGCQCRAGVVYDNVKDKSVKGFAAYPCWKEGEAIPCDKRHYPTPEEVAAKVAEHDASWERLKKGIGACQEDAKTKGFKKGSGGASSVKCPCCEAGTLHYSVASYNGHMHGRCTTPGCVSWMQ